MPGVVVVFAFVWQIGVLVFTCIHLCVLCSFDMGENGLTLFPLCRDSIDICRDS